MTTREQVKHYTLAEIRNGTGFYKDARFVDAEIAAEMLEALEGALTVLEVANIGGRSQYAAPFTVRLRAVIAKAKGEL